MNMRNMTVVGVRHSDDAMLCRANCVPVWELVLCDGGDRSGPRTRVIVRDT